MHRRVRATTIAPLLVVAAAGCSVPRDADGTSARVRGGTIRVGIAENPPWVIDSGGAVGGVEPAMLQTLARDLGARIEWVRRPESELMQALHDRQVDVVLAGLTADLPWKSSVAFTRPYYTDSVVVGIPTGTVMRDVRAQTVAVADGDAIGAVLRARGAQPVVAPDLARASGAVATPAWKLNALGKTYSGILLQERRRVVAVAPGENEWLVRVERSLHSREAAVPRMLREVSR